MVGGRGTVKYAFFWCASIIKIRISICTKGKGNVANIERSYTMKEHYDENYIKDGQAYAQTKLGLNVDEIVIQDWPVIDKSLEGEIEALYGSGNKVIEGKMAIPNVYNPMHSCFKSYRQVTMHWAFSFNKACLSRSCLCNS